MPKITLNGIEINYRDEGEGEDVIVMVHNLTSDITGFDDNIPELAKHYRVIAPDLRGHGFTTHCEDYEEAVEFYTFDNMVEDLIQLLDHLKVARFFLFGQAYWGAGIVAHFSAKYPERVVGLALSSVHIISSDPGVPPYMILPEEGQRNFIRMHKLAREHGMMAVHQDRLVSGQFWSEELRANTSLLEKFAEAHKRTSPAAFVTIPHISHERRAAISKTINGAKIPMLLMFGEKDGHRIPSIPEMREDFPGISTLLIPGCGHYPTSENPHDFNRALLDFFAGVRLYERAGPVSR